MGGGNHMWERECGVCFRVFVTLRISKYSGCCWEVASPLLPALLLTCPVVGHQLRLAEGSWIVSPPLQVPVNKHHYGLAWPLFDRLVFQIWKYIGEVKFSLFK